MRTNNTDALNVILSPLNPQVIEDTLNNLQTAIDNHRAWFTRLHESLMCEQPFEDTVLSYDADTRCQFGQWLNSDASDAILTRPVIDEIKHAHGLLHFEARDIAQTFQQKGMVELQTYRRLTDVQLTLMRKVYHLRDEIISQSHGFDPLTGLINRKSISALLAHCQEQFENYGDAYTVAMLDIDHFKAINDSYGHLVGDEVLKLVSERLLSGLREEDAVGRYGGEEFLMLLHGVDKAAAVPILERVLRSLRESPLRVNEVSVSLTVSAGCADMRAADDVWDVVKAADAALYNAKDNGRDRVVAF